MLFRALCKYTTLSSANNAATFLCLTVLVFTLALALPSFMCVGVSVDVDGNVNKSLLLYSDLARRIVEAWRNEWAASHQSSLISNSFPCSMRAKGSSQFSSWSASLFFFTAFLPFMLQVLLD